MKRKNQQKRDKRHEHFQKAVLSKRTAINDELIFVKLSEKLSSVGKVKFEELEGSFNIVCLQFWCLPGISCLNEAVFC